jgi:hypothetical protein
MKTIVKWLLSVEANGELKIQPRNINSYIPINRILDDTGYFHLDAMEAGGVAYLVVYEPNEQWTVKSKILVAKDNPDKSQPGLVDLTESDLPNMEAVADKYLRTKRVAS